MKNRQLIQQLKVKERKLQLAWQMEKLSTNEVAKQIYKSSDPFLISQEWRDLRKLAIEKYGTTCVKCGALQTKTKRINMDHIKPRKYFPHLALDINNLQPLCSPCNKRKGNRIESPLVGLWRKKMRVGQSKNQCMSCKEYFNSNSAFEKHRTGRYGVDRRCMTNEEMTSKLMEKNAGGYWITEPRLFEREPHAIQEQSGQTA